MNQEVVEKIKKILALAGDKAAHPGEIEAAIGKAKELAMKHNLDLASIQPSSDTKSASAIEVEMEEDLTISTKFRQPYHFPIGGALMKCFGVELIWSGYWEYNGYKVSNVYIIGETIDVAIVKSLFPWLEKVYPKILNKAIKERRLRNCMADINGCYRGITNGIIEANARQEKQTIKKEDAGKYALVVRNKEEAIAERLAKEFPELKKFRSRPTHSFEGLELGREEGRKIKLNQVGGGSASNKIGE